MYATMPDVYESSFQRSGITGSMDIKILKSQDVCVLQSMPAHNLVPVVQARQGSRTLSRNTHVLASKDLEGNCITTAEKPPVRCQISAKQKKSSSIDGTIL